MNEAQEHKHRKYQKWIDDILLEMNQPDIEGWNKSMYKNALQDICKICEHETGRKPKLNDLNSTI